MGRRVDHGKSFAASTSVCITIVAGVVHKLQAKHVYRLVFYIISYFIATAYESRIVYWLLLRLPQITKHFQKRPYNVAVGGSFQLTWQLVELGSTIINIVDALHGYLRMLLCLEELPSTAARSLLFLN